MHICVIVTVTVHPSLTTAFYIAAHMHSCSIFFNSYNMCQWHQFIYMWHFVCGLTPHAKKMKPSQKITKRQPAVPRKRPVITPARSCLTALLLARSTAEIFGSEHFNRHTAAPPHTHHHSPHTTTRTSALGKHASQTPTQKFLHRHKARLNIQLHRTKRHRQLPPHPYGIVQPVEP